jgi:transposase InsO family protein
LSPVIEDVIVEWRKRLQDQGLDAGAATIWWHLGRDGTVKPPSEATIWRVLVRRGLVTPQPSKRPKASFRRFEAEWPNERWQADHCDWALAGGSVVKILNIIDDHSRLCVASVAAEAVTSPVLWAAFWAAGQAWGLPASCLTDNGLVFSGKLRGFEVDFERRLRQAGITAVTSKAFHPQTCGKVERFQQTLKKWLRRRHNTLADLTQLQAAIDEFRSYYNTQRPHRGIARATPQERFGASTPARPAHEALPVPTRRTPGLVAANGNVKTGPWSIQVGVEHAGRHADLVVTDTHASVYIDGQLVRHLELDHTRSYQPSGRPRGGPRAAAGLSRPAAGRPQGKP